MPTIRADFAEAVCLPPEAFRWLASPGGEVERVMLDRVGDETAVATSLVRYPPDSRFPAHAHGQGEEYLVLDGEFADEHGRYPPGTYVRNPPGSRHAPFSDPGCVIWVKLRQFHPKDDAARIHHLPPELPACGIAATELYRFREEVVTVFGVAPDTALSLPPAEQVQEVLVVEGSVRWRRRSLNGWGWLRVPLGQGIELEATAASRLLHKTRPAYAVPSSASASGVLTRARSSASAER